jgi:hypothetical protein
MVESGAFKPLLFLLRGGEVKGAKIVHYADTPNDGRLSDLTIWGFSSEYPSWEPHAARDYSCL